MTPKIATMAILASVMAAAVSHAQTTPAAPGAGAPPAAPMTAVSNPLDVVPDKMPFDIPYGPPITLERGQSLIAAAVSEARKHDWKMNVAVVDSGGNLIAFARMDGALLASVPIAQHKARAAAMFRRETKLFEAAVQSGALSALTLDGMIASRGGLPLVEDGKIIGAIGASGGAGSQDEMCAKAGLAALGKASG